MLLWTWGGWPDPTVDFGTQLYVPWRITQGDTLYLDLAYFKGPLSPHFNAALFAIIGTSLRALVFLNLAILVTTLVLLWTLLRKFTDIVAASACLLIAVLVFSFIQYRYFGNYNWVTPYAHEYTHGIALSLGAMLALHRAVKTNCVPWSIASGALCGLVFLTTAEVFAACALALLVTLIFRFRSSGISHRGRFKHTATFAACVVAISLVAFILLATRMPIRQALLGTLGSWVWIVDSRIAALGYYRASMGLDEPGSRLWRLLTIGVAEFSFFGIAYLIALAIPHLKWRLPARVMTVAGAMIGGALLGAAMLMTVPWFELALPIPMVIAVIAIFEAIAVWRARSFPLSLRERGGVRWDAITEVYPADEATDFTTRPRSEGEGAMRLVFAIFSLVLLAKIALFTRVQHYGFTLALPATLLVVELLVGAIPRRLEARGRAGKTFRAIAIAALSAYVVGILYGHHLFTEDKTVRVASGGDAFIADARGTQVQAALDYLRDHAKPGDTLAMLPQGLMVNYLARLAHPNRYMNFMPPEVISAGEANIVNSYATHPPSWIIVARVNVRGDAFYLLDGEYAYGRTMLKWVKDNYEVVHVIEGPTSDPTAQWLVMHPRKD